METIFKVGDKVWDMSISNKPGEVIRIDNLNFPVKVRFICGLHTYTFDGKIHETAPKTLSHTPYTFEGFSQERPKKEPEIGSLCLFSSHKNNFKNNFGVTSKLVEITEGSKYVAENGLNFNFCKQIEIKEV